MKKTGIALLVLVISLMTCIVVNAQPSIHFVAPTTTVAPGEIFSAPVRVSGFNRIVGAQYSMTWNPTILRFDGITSPALNMSVMDNFGLSSTASGVLSFSWYDQTVVGMTLADSSVLFNIRFQAIGANNSFTPLAFGSQPTATEVVDTSLTAIPVGFQDGQITIMQPSAVDDVFTRYGFRLGEPQPNPFKSETIIEIDVADFISLRWALYDATGKELLMRTQDYSPGRHQISIHEDLLPNVQGNIFCKIYLPNGEIISRKILKM